jgi:GTPase SAR1 family protein
MGGLIFIILAIVLYCLYIYALFWVSAVLFPLGCIAFIGAVLFNYLKTIWTKLFLGDGWKDSPEGHEPAFRQYYFRKAYHDYKYIVEESWKPNQATAKWIIDTGAKLFAGDKVLFTWPLGLTVFLIGTAGAIAGGAAYLIFGLVHLLLVLICAVLAISLAFILRIIEYISMIWRHIFLVCPNAGCYKKIGLPIYICPNCGVQHKHLIPGSYGIFRRECQCGAKLPTLFLFGRNNLPSICPHEGCHRPLSSSIGVARNLHVPIVGGPAAGKTSFMMASMHELHRRADRGQLAMEFPEKKHRTLYEHCDRNFMSGALLGKTAEDSPDAFLVKLNDGGGEKLLYIYDAAGELYQQTDALRRHEYYSYTHGVLFLLDPFSLPQVQIDFEHDLRTAAAQVKPCEERSQDVYDRMIGTLRQFSKMSGSFGAVPIAVVITKADAFGLAADIESTGNGNGINEKHKDDDPESLSVRQWLISHGEGNLVRSIEHDFKKVHYFHCSALGRLPDSGSAPFVPEGVIDPLSWVLKPYGLRLDGSKRTGSLAATPARSSTPYTVKVGGRSFNGMVISTLWTISTACLIVVGCLWLIKFVPWSVRGNTSNYSSSAYTSTPQPTIGRTGITSTDVNLHSSPNSKGRKVGLAERGSQVRILSISNGSWYEIEILRHGRTKIDRNSSDRGWLNSQYISLQ